MGRNHTKPPQTRLRAERLLHGLTIGDMIMRTGNVRGRMFFSRLETGGPARLTPDIAAKIGEALGVDPGKIFDESDR